MPNDSITLRGDLAAPGAFQKLADDIVAGLNRQLPEVAAAFRETFVANALTNPGPNSLGQVTGNLANSFVVDTSDVFGVSTIKGYVEPGEAFIYGSKHDDRIGWFQHGVDSSTEQLLINLAQALEKSIREVDK